MARNSERGELTLVPGGLQGVSSQTAYATNGLGGKMPPDWVRY
jgi:hypothetical protein